MPEMTARQQAFLSAVLLASKRQNSVVDVSRVCERLRMRADECGEILRWAEKAGILNDLGNDQAILTGAGRDVAERFTPSEG